MNRINEVEKQAKKEFYARGPGLIRGRCGDGNSIYLGTPEEQDMEINIALLSIDLIAAREIMLNDMAEKSKNKMKC
ncbi:MAG: hypothetical protein LBI17_01380 [Rickettsiales bacterium]|jgi:hypothetical protein|nr:hypothetical protein [Rickettsiales bacterium]